KAEEEKRQTEIARLKKEQKEKKIATLEKEIEKFKKIISSKFGKDMKASAWKSLAARYPEAADAVKEGNTECLLYKFINPSRFITESSGVVYDKKTGLEWTTMRYKVSTWKYARNWVADLQVAGGRWRLPSVSELKSIYHKSATQCNWPPLFETNEGLVWSSETLSKREPRMLSKEESAGWKRGMATPMKTEWYAKAVDFYNSGIVKKTYQTRHARIFAVRSRR
ncbi:MAG: DUF1566 domain-containing protein, partial [Acidobacteriota bacterium]|nr:DUF1566 domain-containing protein [Acidobacteriota bacterium]